MDTQQLKQQLVMWSSSGWAGRIRTIIVSEALWNALKAESTGFRGKLGANGQKGHLWIRYGFDLLMHPDYESVWNFPREGFFGVPQTVDAYQERYLGKEHLFMQASQSLRASDNTPKDASLDEYLPRRHPNLGIRELNPIVGSLELSHGWNQQYMCYEDAVEFRSADPTCYLEDYVTNPPEVGWLGNVESLKAGDWASLSKSHRLFMDFPDMPERTPGTLYMRRSLAHGWQMMVVALDGFARKHEFQMNKPTSDAQTFVQQMLPFFTPEEIHVFMHFHGQEVDVAELWEQITLPSWHNRGGDPEALGRIKDWGDQARVECADSYGLQRSMKIPGEVSSYFPENWQGWPETTMDRNIAAFARAIAN